MEFQACRNMVRCAMNIVKCILMKNYSVCNLCNADENLKRTVSAGCVLDTNEGLELLTLRMCAVPCFFNESQFETAHQRRRNPPGGKHWPCFYGLRKACRYML